MILVSYIIAAVICIPGIKYFDSIFDFGLTFAISFQNHHHVRVITKSTCHRLRREQRYVGNGEVH